MLVDDLRAALTRHTAWLRRAVWVVLLAGLFAFLVRGADSPADPHVERAARRPLAGFPEVVVRVTVPSGGFFEWCALLAASPAAHAQGLMDQTDLRGYDAMVFRFDAPSTDAFYMFHTVLPLSVSWFDNAGRFVSAADMPPCPSNDPNACPLYKPARAYTTAIETTRGGAARLGLLPGSAVSFPGGRCS